MAKKYLPIRLSEELIKKVTEKAKKAKRSRNQYIEILIENDLTSTENYHKCLIETLNKNF
jgi:hypothetical protein